MAKKDLSPDELNKIYASATIFAQKLDGHIAVIDANVKKLSDPAVLDGMQGGTGDVIVDAVKQISKTVEMLRDNVSKVRSFIDVKQTKLHDQIMKDHVGANDAKDAVKRTGNLLR